MCVWGGDKDMKLTDIRLEALSSAHQLEQLRETMAKMKVSTLGGMVCVCGGGDKDMKLTDIRLEALSSAHQLEQLRETMAKMKVSTLGGRCVCGGGGQGHEVDGHSSGGVVVCSSAGTAPRDNGKDEGQ